MIKTQNRIAELVKLQPNPSLFYKSFLELDASNMTSVLAFDSRSMIHLLDDANEEYFEQKYPVIYRNKLIKKNSKNHYYNSPIDIALKSNQVRAVDKMIEYIVKY